MTDLTGIRFSGHFRAYQQRVLDHFERHLADGHIHIVAAPGSGKTILGLEIICRLQAPCLILSPTTTIKHQWGDRFSAFFLPDGADPDDYISYDLRRVAPLTSVTYQAVYSAMKKLPCADDEETVDYADIDLFRLIRDNGIKTVCLDEAHHLQNEWHKALEPFLAGLGGAVTTVALTATPPYDAGKAEWDRYIAVCEEIDEGWDSPCVNTLILASYVGSFMLSNQMRGRAIRRDPDAPDEVSNIWHLVTAEPDYLFADSGSPPICGTTPIPWSRTILTPCPAGSPALSVRITTPA